MAENKLNAIVVIGGTSLEYFSNVRWGNSERLFTMVLPVRGEPFFVAPAFEKDRAVEQIGQGPFGESPHVFTWEENESPYQVVAFALKERGLATGNIGVEERVTVRFRGRHNARVARRETDQRDGGHRRLPHDQESRRNRADAPSQPGHPRGVRSRLEIAA